VIEKNPRTGRTYPMSRRGFVRSIVVLAGSTTVATLLQACGGTATPTPAAQSAPAPTSAPAAQPTAAPAAQPTAAPAAPTVAATTAPATATPAAQAASQSASQVKIRATVWVDKNELAANDQMTKLYQQTHPNVALDWINITGGGPYGRDKLQTMIAGGDAPDMMMLNTGQFEGLAARNALLALDDLAKEEKTDLSIFWPSAVEGCKYQGKLYGMPRDISNVVLYYNKDLFDKAKVAHPTDTWTWDDFLAAAKKLTISKSGGTRVDQWGFGLLNFVWAWAGFVWGNGGEILSPDHKQSHFEDAPTVEALKFYFDLQTADKVSPPPGSLPQQATALDWFSNQAVAMGLFGPWYRPVLAEMKQPFHWDVAYPPKAPKTGKRGSVVYTDMWGIYPSSKVAKDTFDFMTFFSGPAGQQKWVDLLGARSITPVQEVAKTAKWLNYGGSTGQIILDSLSFSQPPPVNFGNADQVENTWNDEFGLVIAGQENVQQAAKNIDQKIDPILAKGP